MKFVAGVEQPPNQNDHPRQQDNPQKGLAVVGCCVAVFVCLLLLGYLSFGAAFVGRQLTPSQSMVFALPLFFSLLMLPGAWMVQKFPQAGKALMVVSVIGSTAYLLPTFLLIRSLLHTRGSRAGDGVRVSAKRVLGMLFMLYVILMVLGGLLKKSLPTVHPNSLAGLDLDALGFIGSWGVVIVLILLVYSILKKEIRFE